MKNSQQLIEANKDLAHQEDKQLEYSIIKQYYKYVELNNLLIILKEYGLKTSKFELESIISDIKTKSSIKRESLTKEELLHYRATQLYHNAKNRAKKKNLDFNLTLKWIKKRLKKNKCQATNIKFSTEANSPYSPSLDRIQPELGYIKANTQMVIINYNKMKSSHTEESAIRIAKALIKFKS